MNDIKEYSHNLEFQSRENLQLELQYWKMCAETYMRICDTFFQMMEKDLARSGKE